MGIAEEYAKRFRKEHGVHARYTEGPLLQLGTFGRMDDGVFAPLGTFAWVVERFSKDSSEGKASYTLSVGEVTTTGLAAKAQLPGDPALVLVNAGVQIDFKKSFSALLILKGVKVERVQNLQGLEQELLRRQQLPKNHPDWFDPSLRVVTEVTVVDQYWLCAAKEAGGGVVLEASADVPTLDLANLSVGLNARRETKAHGTLKGGRSTPLFRLTGLSRAFPLLAPYRPGFLSGGLLSADPPAPAGVPGAPSGGPRPAATERSAGLLSLLQASAADAFDHVYVVSDLHVGGEGSMQAYTDDLAMGWLGRHLAQKAETARVCWAIGGDIIDFLAYADRKNYFDPEDALRRLEQIASSNPETFAAWRTFAKAKQGTLVFLLGNHDLELGMTEVWTRFCELAGIPTNTLCLQGADLRVRVGDQRVCVKHGNEADEWNAVKYGELAEFDARLRSWRRWIPNKGTALVIDNMNAVKKEYPFVDLLKPEEGTVAIFLLALLPPGELAGGLPGTLWKDAATTARKIFSGRVGEDDSPTAASATQASPVNPQDLLKATLADLKAGVEPMDLLGASGQLSTADYGLARSQGISPEASVYLALQDQLGDRSFDVFTRDKWFDWFDDNYPEHTDVLIVGHTHLAKLIRRSERSVYVNSGTWMPLVDLPEVLSEGQDRFETLFGAIKQKSVASLEDAGFIRRRRTVVHVGPGVVELCSVQRADEPYNGRVEGADVASLALVPIADCRRGGSGS